MYVSYRSEAMGLQRLSFFKYYNVLKWESRFNFGLDAAKIPDYIRKWLKQKLLTNKFRIKKSVGTHVYFPQGWN